MMNITRDYVEQERQKLNDLWLLGEVSQHQFDTVNEYLDSLLGNQNIYEVDDENNSL